MNTITKNDITRIFTLIQAEFPRTKEIDAESLRLRRDFWFEELSKYPREIVFAGVKKAITEQEFEPKLPTVVKYIKAIMQVDKKKAIDLWNEVEDTFPELAFISRDIGQPYSSSRAWDDYKQDFCGYTYEQRGRENLQKVFDTLPSEVKRYFGYRPERLLAFYRMEDKDQSFEKTRFINALPDLMANEEQKEENELSGFNKYLDEGKKQALPDGDKKDGNNKKG